MYQRIIKGSLRFKW